MAKSIRFSIYKKGDETSICDLFKLAYGRNLSKKYWKWRFVDNPCGEGIIYLAWQGNKLAAHYAVSPITLSNNGKIASGCLSGTTMTHPDFRGMGLFPELASRTYKKATDLGIKSVWGFPNNYSHRILVGKLGWKDIYEIPTFRLRFKNIMGSNLATGRPKEITELDPRFDSLWNKTRNNAMIKIQRNREFLQWRFLENPSEKYRILIKEQEKDILGYLIFKQYKKEFQIVDLWPVDNVSVGLELITGTLVASKKQDLDGVSLWLNAVTPLHLELEKLGFQNESHITYMTTLALGGSKWPNGFNRYYVCMGDSDVY
jgi:predicted acetyltransferase